MRSLILLLSIIFFTASAGLAASGPAKVKAGNKLFGEGKYEEAIQEYLNALKKDSDSAPINYNLGTAYYKSGQLSSAAAHLQKALLSEDKALKQKTYYNLGNTYYRSGQAREEKGDLDSAVSFLEKARDSYAQSLELNPQDQDASANLKLTEKELERIKEDLRKREKNKPAASEEKNSASADTDESKDDQSRQDKTPADGVKQDESVNQDQAASEKTWPEDEQAKDNVDGQSDEPETLKPSTETGTDGRQPGTDDQAGANNFSVEKSPESNNMGSVPEDSSMGTFGEIERDASGDEADRILEEYMQVQEPKGLFNPMRNRRPERGVIKDW